MDHKSHYRSALAQVHDQNYGQHAQQAARELLGLLQKRGFLQGLIVGLGCGSGILEERMSREGYDTQAVDYSEALIDIARRRCPEGQFEIGSLMNYEIPQCLAVAATGEVLNYRFDERHRLENLLPLFEKIFWKLQPGGIFLFDIIEPGIMDGRPPIRLVENEQWNMILDYSENKEAATLHREITLFLKEGSLYRKSKEVHRLNLYHRESVRQLLEQAGFMVSLINNYAGKKFRDHHIGFIAERRDLIA